MVELGAQRRGWCRSASSSRSTAKGGGVRVSMLSCSEKIGHVWKVLCMGLGGGAPGRGGLPHGGRPGVDEGRVVRALEAAFSRGRPAAGLGGGSSREVIRCRRCSPEVDARPCSSPRRAADNLAQPDAHVPAIDSRTADAPPDANRSTRLAGTGLRLGAQPRRSARDARVRAQGLALGRHRHQAPLDLPAAGHEDRHVGHGPLGVPGGDEDLEGVHARRRARRDAHSSPSSSSTTRRRAPGSTRPTCGPRRRT